MKIKLGILLLVSGLLFFGLGCLADSVAIEGIGAVAFFPGIDGGDGEDLEGGGRFNLSHNNSYRLGWHCIEVAGPNALLGSFYRPEESEEYPWHTLMDVAGLNEEPRWLLEFCRNDGAVWLYDPEVGGNVYRPLYDSSG